MAIFTKIRRARAAETIHIQSPFWRTRTLCGDPLDDLSTTEPAESTCVYCRLKAQRAP